MCKICVFAGTSEGRQLVDRLRGRGASLTVCVATRYGEELLGAHGDVRVLTGRLDGENMEQLFRQERFDAVVDATHPYADRATENIAAACESTGTPYLRLARESSADAADGVFVRDAEECAEYLKATGGNILLTTGSKELPCFCADEALKSRLYARVLPMAGALEICAQCGIAPDHIIAMQGPFDEELNLAMLRSIRAKYLVTKDTGSAGGYEAKIHAALRAGAQAVIIGRPPQREGQSPEEIASALEKRFSLRPARKTVALVGTGMGGEGTRTLDMLRAIREADCLIGARRMLGSVDCAGKRVYEAFAPAEVSRIIREETQCRRFAVLLSGDTGFFSGAKKLLTALEGMETEVLPGVSSLQYFAARLGRSWEDVRAVSLHGRDCDLEREARENPSLFVLLGGEGGADKALCRLRDAGLGSLSAAVGERLGCPEERISRGTVEALIGRAYDPLSVLMVDNPACGRDVVTCGLPDEAFDRDETPMTKSEVRAVSLSKMSLKRDSVVYDVGSGSGSVTVEAARMASRGRVYAIEMKPEAAALTRRNVEKFHLTNVTVVEGRAPEALEELPAPTHAFIGGSTGSMRQIVERLLEKNPRVRIVANAVTMESVAELGELVKAFECSDVAQIGISKPRKLGRYRLMTAQNPVWVFTLWNETTPEGEK